MKIAIIILNYNGKEDTLACLASLQTLHYRNFITYVVDNASHDGSVEAIRNAFPEVRLLPQTKNLGFAGGNNIALKAALNTDIDAVFLLNNDTLVTPSLLDTFLETYRDHPDAGILGGTLYLFSDPTTLDHLGGMWNPKKAGFDFVGNRAKTLPFHKPTPLDFLCGAALFIPKKTLLAIGLFEEDFFLIWEDADLCFRARRAGFKVLTCPETKVLHKVSASFSGKPHSTYFFWRGRFLFIKRNFPLKTRLFLYCSVIFPELVHLLTLYLLKNLQYRFSQKNRPRKQAFLLKTKAALLGASHYLRGKFGGYPLT